MPWFCPEINAVESSLNGNLNRPARRWIFNFLSSAKFSPECSDKNETKENMLFTILALIPDLLGQLTIKTDLETLDH